jgi:GAF domain-containing protein
VRIDEERVRASVDRLHSADLRSGELEASLREVIAATQEIFGADGAGLMLLDDQDALHYVGATDGRSAAFEAAQEECGEGPCVDSLVHDQVVASTDLEADDRWPKLQVSVGGLGIRAMLGVPIHLGGPTVGSLNVFRAEPSPWDDSEIAAISAHGRVLEELLGAAVLARQRHTIVAQLTEALENRVTIERAVGVLMARKGLDPTGAFNQLRQAARSSRRRVKDVAAEVLAEPAFAPPEPPPADDPDARGPS